MAQMNLAAKLDRQLSQILDQVRIQAGTLNAGSKIIVNAWVVKLTEQQSHLEWKKNRNLYGVFLLDMLMKKTLDEPFNKRPPDVALPTLPAHIKQYYMRTTSDILARSIDETGSSTGKSKLVQGKTPTKLASSTFGARSTMGTSTAQPSAGRRNPSLLHSSQALSTATAIYTPRQSVGPAGVDSGLLKSVVPTARNPPGDPCPLDPVGLLLKRIYAPEPTSMEVPSGEAPCVQPAQPALSQSGPLGPADRTAELEAQLAKARLRIQELEAQARDCRDEAASLRRVVDTLGAEDSALAEAAWRIHAEALRTV